MINIAKVGKDLMIKEPLYGLYLLNINKIITNSISTLAVGLEGINTVLLINENCWNSLTNTEKFAVLKHEIK